MSEHAARATCNHTLTTMPRDSLHALVGPLFAGVKKDENSSCRRVASRYIACIEGNQSDEQQKNKMNTYQISTDAVTTKIAAANEDEAAAKFARNEPVYAEYTINCVADLMWAAKQMGGWAKVNDAE